MDGFTAGPNRSASKPFGDGAVDRLTQWMFEQPEANAAEIDAILAAGAFIMGPSIFRPRPRRLGRELDGLVGRRPAVPRARLRPRPTFRASPSRCRAARRFNFVTDGIESALAQAREAAGSGDVSIAGGASTVNQYLAAGAIDELRLHVAPIVLGVGERLFDGVGALSLERVGVNATDLVTHLTYRARRLGRSG